MLVNQPNGYKELGLYSAVIIFSTAIQMFNGAIGNVLLPIFLSKSEGKSPKKEFFNYFGSWIISIMIAIPLILFPEVTSLILGKKFSIEQIVPILGMSIITTLIITNRAGVSRDLIVKNKMWLSVFSMGQWAITNLIIFYFLKDLGAWGFAFSYMISYVINYLVFVPYFINKGISPRIIFYNKWNMILWLMIASLVAVNVYYFDVLFLRIIISVIILLIILFSIFKLYKVCLQKL
ncbi:hypothetical protein [Chryseobacterium nepalense]|nr:O-antigen/teichoic acid export membrane protein [Chryseobacterium nepalense]